MSLEEGQFSMADILKECSFITFEEFHAYITGLPFDPQRREEIGRHFSSCQECGAEFRSIQELHDAYKTKGLM